MTLPQATLAGLALIALAILVTRGPVAADPGTPTFTVHSNEAGAWRANAETGQVSFCAAFASATETPRCTAWTARD